MPRLLQDEQGGELGVACAEFPLTLMFMGILGILEAADV